MAKKRVGLDFMLANELIDEDQLSQETSLTRRFYQQCRSNGKGPKFIRISSKAVRYRRSDVNAWLQSLEAATDLKKNRQIDG